MLKPMECTRHKAKKYGTYGKHYIQHFQAEHGVSVALTVYDTGECFLSANGSIEINEKDLILLKTAIETVKTLPHN